VPAPVASPDTVPAAAIPGAVPAAAIPDVVASPTVGPSTVPEVVAAGANVVVVSSWSCGTGSCPTPESGNGSGGGSTASASSSAPTMPAASHRRSGSTAPQRSTTVVSGPSPAGAGIGRSSRATSVARVVSAAKGTVPVMASMSTSVSA